MDEQGPIRRLIPALIGVILIGIGIFIFTRATGGYLGVVGYALLGIGFILAGSILIAFPLTHQLSGVFGNLFYPDEKFRRAPPLYSRAEALAKMDHFDDAMKAYEQIVEEYPDELKPYIDMIEIAIGHYQDADRANQIFQRGIATLVNQDDRDTLSRMYKGMRSRIEDKKEWQKTRTLHLNE